MNRNPIIGVMGSHEKEWGQYASVVGNLIAEYDYHLLTGAGAGVMTAVARTFTENTSRDGYSIGIIPTADYDGTHISRDEYPNPYIEIPIVTALDRKALGDTMPYSRNLVNIMSSDAIIILPGDHGTRNESSLAIKYKKPAILFGPENTFQGFPAQHTWTDSEEEIRVFLEHVRTKLRDDEE